MLQSDFGLETARTVIAAESEFWSDARLAAFGIDPDGEQALNVLVFAVRKQPADLLGHLRRIYRCYRSDLSEQLFAALLDLTIILGERGSALRARLLAACRGKLSASQAAALLKPGTRVANRYTLFTDGMLGSSDLVQQVRGTDTQYDYLALANDFIEYSQLSQAIEALETGLIQQPEREDLQNSLLELYRSTKNAERFRRQYRALSDAGVALVDGWRQVAVYFDGISS
ncbi:hypothetical protein HC024_04975 [Methylococcaceae bacterium WWC4]|nr:hypothetical protein [Methylococcaceae bacterium WWC4]